MDLGKVTLMTEVDSLRRGWQACEARLATVEAERDAARAEAEARTTIAARAQEALRYLMNGLPTNDAVWAAYGNADSARAWLADRDSQYQAALLAAQSGEARAVEALEAEQRAAHWRNLARITDKHEDHIEATRLSEIAQRLRHGIVLVLDRNISALDWLAQQRREAAAEVVNALADGCERAKRPILAQELRGHVAALLAGAEALERLEAMESSSSTMLPKSASESEEGR